MRTIRKYANWRPVPFFLLALLVTGISSAGAAIPAASLPQGTFSVVSARSDVRTRVSSTLHDFDVEAKVSRGEVVIPSQADGSVRLVIEFSVKEMNSGNFMRDQVMQSDVLEAEKFPDVRFRSEKIAFMGSGPEGTLRFQVEGKLTMHGVEKKLSIPILVSSGQDQISAQAQFPIRISDYGMKVPSPLPFLKTEDVLEVTARFVLRNMSK